MFRDALQGLRNGDFSKLEPLFAAESGTPKILEWHRQGRFRDEPDAVAEALTCACFLGRVQVAEYLLARGVDPSGGAGTGMNALHWAVNRGQLEAVRLLLQRQAPLETRSMYEGTALGAAVWAAVHEPRSSHLEIIEELLRAGASLSDCEYPSGRQQVDELLNRYRRDAGADSK
jgi:ankyrin repeat protein